VLRRFRTVVQYGTQLWLSLEKKPRASPKGFRFRLGLYALFLLCGFLVFAVSSVSPDLSIGTAAVPLLFLLTTIALHGDVRFKTYWEVFFAFFVFSFVWFTRHLILDSASVHPFYATLSGNVVAQLVDTTVVIIPIVLLTLASGSGLSSIFLRKGDLKLGSVVGLMVLAIFYLLSAVVAISVAGMSPSRFLFLSPFLLVLALTNGFKEELWFRGLFLNKYEPLLGVRLSNFLQAPIFAMSVVEAEFSSVLIGIVLVSFFLGLGLGYLMRRTGSILGSSLCEAGSVIPIFLVVISALR